MLKKCRSVVLGMLWIMAVSVPSYGWFGAGHMTVAYVAYQQLTPATKDRVDALLRLNPEYDTWVTMIPTSASDADKRMMVFMIAATWPDRIKKNGAYKDDGTAGGNIPDGASSRRNIGYSDLLKHKYWHFVDMPFTQDGTKLTKQQSKIPTPNALTQIIKFRGVLASNRPDPLKSYDLVWLLHIVGDVHQPLHCTQRFGKTQKNGDAGGNLVKLSSEGTLRELHAFWDSRPGDSDSPLAAINVGKNLPPADATLAAIGDASVWIDESFQLAKEKAYVNPPIGLGAGPFTLNGDYRAEALRIANERVALGGARLANILNNELK